MFRDIDWSKKPNKAKFSLHKPNKSKIANLTEAHNAQMIIKQVGLNELSFMIPYEIEINHKLVRNKHVDMIKNRYLVKVVLGSYTEWFIVSNPIDNSDDQKDFMEVKCFSLERELRDGYVRSYQELAKSLKDVSNEMLTDTNWTLAYVPSDHTVENSPTRSFDISSKTKLDIIFEIGEKFNLIPQFDNSNRTVSFYKESELTQNKGFHISEQKYLKTITKRISEEDVCTRLFVFGQDGISIQRVNPNGQSYIEDFSYFMYPFYRDDNRNVIFHSDWMSDELCHAELDYQDLLLSKKGEFDSLLDNKAVEELNLQSAQNDLKTLQDELTVIQDNIETKRLAGEDTTTLEQDETAKKAEIDTKQNEINQIESNISTIDSDIATLRNEVSLENNFTPALLEERRQYTISKPFSDDSYTDDQELYLVAIEKLEDLKFPQTIIEIDIVNFLEVISEQRDWDKINLGDQVNIKHSQLGIDVTAKIIEVNYDFENRSVSLKIANIRNAESYEKRLMKLLMNAQSSSDVIDLKKYKWDNEDDVISYTDQQIDELKLSLLDLDINLKRISADGYITQPEAETLKNSLDQVKAESTDLINIADTLSITTEVTNYQTELTNLETTLSNWINQTDYPKSILLTDRDSIKLHFESVQNAKSILINAIAAKREENANTYTDGQIDDVNTSLNGLQDSIDEYSSDAKITLAEANALENALLQLEKESEDLINIATGLSISTTNYTNALNDLNSYLTTNWINQSSYPLDITSTQRNDVNTKFQTVQDNKSILINKIAEQRETNAKDYAQPAINEIHDSSFENGKEFFVERFDSDISNGTIVYGAGENGANVLELTNENWILSKNYIPIDTSNSYKVRFKVKQTVDSSNGEQRVYAGVATYDSNLNPLTDGVGIHRYCAVAGTSIQSTDGWQVFEGIISGIGDAHDKFRSNTAYIRPMFIVNYSAGDGTTQVDYIEFLNITESLEGKDAYEQTKNTIRNGNPISAPTISSSGSAVDHTINTDGTANVSFEWAFTEDANSPISGFGVITYSSDSSSSHTPSIISDDVIYKDKDSRYHILKGVPANKYYTFGIYAYRLVDTSINSNGIIRSAIAKPSLGSENPYRPSTNVQYYGDILGTIGGTPYDEVNKSTVTAIIADASTSNNFKIADYVVPIGTKANVVIQQAIDNLPANGGKIAFLDGQFDCDSSITLKDNVMIEGQGESTVINGDAFIDGNSPNKIFDLSNRTNVSIKNMTIKTSYSSLTDCPNGIHLNNSTNIRITDCNFDKCRTSIFADSSYDVSVIGCKSLNAFTNGIKFSSSNNLIISYCFSKNSRYGGIAGYGDNISITNCFAIDNSEEGIYLSSSNSVITGNVSQGNGHYGISSLNLTKCKVANNEVRDNDLDGLWFPECIETNVNNNTVTNNGKSGIELSRSYDSNIVNNTFIGNGTSSDNTYSNIYLEYDVDGLNIQGNTCRIGNNVNRPKYGIEIANSNCSDNFVINNDLRNSGVSGSFSDAGTNTVTTSGNKV